MTGKKLGKPAKHIIEAYVSKNVSQTYNPSFLSDNLEDLKTFFNFESRQNILAFTQILNLCRLTLLEVQCSNVLSILITDESALLAGKIFLSILINSFKISIS